MVRIQHYFSLILLVNLLSGMFSYAQKMDCDSLYKVKKLVESRDCYFDRIKNKKADDTDKMILAKISKEINDTSLKIIKIADSLYSKNKINAAYEKYIEAAHYSADNASLWAKISKLYILFYNEATETVKENILKGITFKQDSILALKYYNSARILFTTRMQFSSKLSNNDLLKFDNAVDSLKFLDKYPIFESDGNFTTERVYFGTKKFKFYKRDSKGVLLNDGYSVNELPDSISTQYYPDGKIKYTNIWKNGKLNGESLYLYPEGNIGANGFYVKGQKQGKFFEFYKDGRIKSETNYTNDTLDGGRVEYYSSSKPSLSVNYKMNKLDGKYTEYYENGNKKMEANYLNDQLDGVWTEWYETGVKKLEKHYHKNSPLGKPLFYSEDGKLIRDTY